MFYPKVSIVIVNWNNFADTSECLESLKKITYPNYEIILVDNGSDGDDVRLIKETFNNYVRLIENDSNFGFAEGCNIGIEDALGRGADYVALLNNDTVVAPDFLDELISIVDSDKKVGIAGGMVYCYEIPEMIWFAGGTINYWTGTTLIRGSGEADRGQFEEIIEVDWICGCFMVISRNLLQTVGMLDKRFFFGWEDADLCVRATKAGFKILFVPGSKIWHKTLPPEKQERLMGLPVYYATKGRFIFIEKHFSRLQLASAGLYFIVKFPWILWDYSRILGKWKVPLYIVWGIWGYMTSRCLTFLKRWQNRFDCSR